MTRIAIQREFAKMSRPTRLALGILGIAATAWLTYDLCRTEFKMRERILLLQTHRSSTP